MSHIQRITLFLGYDLLVASTSAEGLTLLDQHPDLILTDSRLPDGDGISFIRQVQQHDTITPVVAISGYAVVGEPERYLQAHCTEYFIKPITVSVLIQLLKRYIR